MVKAKRTKAPKRKRPVRLIVWTTQPEADVIGAHALMARRPVSTYLRERGLA